MAQPSPVYLAAWGHCSGRGLTATSAAAAMLAGETASSRRAAGGENYPYFRLPLPHAGWLERAEAALQACAAPVRGMLPGARWRDLPVFFASSSFQVGLHEQPEREGTPLAPGAASFAAHCARWLGLAGVPHCVSNACTSSMMALDMAASWLAQGIVPHALVLATELDNTLTANGFLGLGLLSPDACRPFARNRNGFVLGEGVAALLLTTDPALAAAPRWRLASHASGIDAFALTGPDPSGGPIAALIRSALHGAGLMPKDIDLVKLHAAGVGETDTAEALGLQQVLGQHRPPLLSLKPYVGHTLGASGLTELTALLACLEQGGIPATPGCEQPDPALGLTPVVKRQALAPRHILLLSVGFGGSMAASILSREQVCTF